MMRIKYGEQLALMNKMLTDMGMECEEMISMAAKCLKSGDEKMLEKIMAMDEEVDHLERDIESLCMRMLLQQQPVATDLRQISAALKMITDMERIGDQASDIAEIISFMKNRASVDSEIIEKMAEATMRMVNESVDAYIKNDAAIAQGVIEYDDVVDVYFKEIKGKLIQMIAANDAHSEDAIDLLMIAKYFEKIGDHAVNVAEWVLFSIKGEH